MARIVGETVSLTRNKLIMDSGQIANVFCGADILLSGLYQNVKGEATCPVCETEIEIAVENQRVTKVNPSSSLLHYVVKDRSAFSICCEATFIFDKEQCLEKWLDSYRSRRGAVSSLQDFMNEAISRRAK